MADYGFDPDLPPEISADSRALQTRQMIAQMLMKQGQQKPQGQMVGRFYVPPSPFEGLNGALSSYVGMQGMLDSNKDSAALASKYREGVTNALTDYQQQKTGTPASSIAWNEPTRPDGTGDATTPVPAVAGNPRAAVMSAMASQYPQLRNIGTADYQQMVKAPEKVDAGDKIILMKEGVKVGEVPKSASPDATLSATTATRGQDLTSANAAEGHRITAAGQKLTDNREREVYGLPEAGASPSPDGKVGTLSPMLEGQAQAIANGKQAPITSRSGKPSPIMARVMEINPDYDAKDYGTHQVGEKFFTSGKGGQQTKTFNAGVAHLGTLDGLVDALSNNDTPAINKLSNMWKEQTGETAPGNFEAAKKVVGNEIVKAIIGAGGGVSDREEASKTLDAANSPAQLKQVIATYKELMRGQLSALNQQYQSATGKNDYEKRFLSPEAQSVASPGQAGQPRVVDW